MRQSRSRVALRRGRRRWGEREGVFAPAAGGPGLVFYRDVPMGFMGFNSKKDCRQAVRQEIVAKGYQDGVPQFGIEFESDLISSLIEHHHYYCKDRGLRPDKFRLDINWDHPGGSYLFMAHFPGRGWKPTSWNKAIDETTFEQHCAASIRGYVKHFSDERIMKYPVCELCGERPSVDAHHDNPQFKSVADFVLTMIRPEDKEWMLENYFAGEEHATDLLLLDHPAVQMAVDIHRSAAMRLIAVCKECHKVETRRRAWK